MKKVESLWGLIDSEKIKDYMSNFLLITFSDKGWNGKILKKKDNITIYIEQIENLNNSCLLNWIYNKTFFTKKRLALKKKYLCTFLN